MMENNNQDPVIEDKEPKKKWRKRKIAGKFIAYLGIFLITAIVIFSSQVLRSEHGSSSWFLRLPIIKQIKQLAESADRTLKGDDENRINILLLGIGGANHEGGQLTDTIMVASIEPEEKKIALVSVPRDLAVPIEGMGWKKINHVNAYAEADNSGSGGLATSQAISDVLNIPIDYYVRVDFAGFVNIVDELGGITVNVENTLSDAAYPILGREEAEPYESRYEHLYVEKGKQYMDGALSLKFARSRHAYGVEGSDFARAKRQQNIISAVKEKALSKDMFLKPKTVFNIIGELKEHISTNLKIWEIVKLWDIVKDIDRANISSKVLDDAPNGLLTGGRSEEGAYILSPRSGDFNEIQYLVNNVFAEAPAVEKTLVAKDNARVELYNGTWINGLASRKAQDIEKYGFIITRIGNSSKQNFQKTVIYDLTFGEKPESLAILKKNTNANISLGLPEWLIEEIDKKNKNDGSSTQPDFIIVLGQEADQSESGTANPIE